MASVSETKKLVLGLGTKMSGLSKVLDTSKSQFDSAKTQAENVVRGSSSDVESTMVGKMQQASQQAQSAKDAVDKAIAACTKYADSKV